jgi:GTP-binding protein HflX
VDVAHAQAGRQAEAVFETLEDIGAAGKPIIGVLNKIDRLPDPDTAFSLIPGFSDGVSISALTGVGLDGLLARVEGELEEQMVRVEILIPYDLGELVDLYHRRGLIEREEHTEAGTRIAGRLPRELTGRFSGLLGDGQPGSENEPF